MKYIKVVLIIIAVVGYLYGILLLANYPSDWSVIIALLMSIVAIGALGFYIFNLLVKLLKYIK